MSLTPSSRPMNGKHIQSNSNQVSDRLALSSAANARRTHLWLADRLSLGTWRRIGEQIYTIGNSSAWWLGDWIIYGKKAFPQHYQRAIEETSLNYQTLRNYAWVARRIPVSRRRDRLSFQHHAVVAPLSEEEQDLWLDRAVAFGWSLHELRRQVKSAKSTAKDVRELPSHALTIPVPIEIQARWQAAAEIQDKNLTDWIVSVVSNASDQLLENGQ